MNIPNELIEFESIMKTQVPLSSCTYMKVGGIADYVATIHDRDMLVEIIARAKSIQLPFYIVGGGSNTIFTDAGFRGLIILNRTSSISINKETKTILADSGVPTNLLVNQSVAGGLSGLELFLGIPGSIGGAVYNNSHYLDILIGDFVSKVELLKEDGKRVWVAGKELSFSYDYSILQESKDVILQVEFTLGEGDIQELQTTSKNALLRRKNTQPLEVPSSGCIFKNFKDEVHLFPSIPSGIATAGALIDSLGLKNMTVGGAEISQVHANFIINNGNASTNDVIELSNKIIDIVKSKYGLTLKREVFFINEFGERTHV